MIKFLVEISCIAGFGQNIKIMIKKIPTINAKGDNLLNCKAYASFKASFNKNECMAIIYIYTRCYPSKFDGKYFNFVWFLVCEF